MRYAAIAAAGLALWAGRAQGDAQAGGFTVRQTAEVRTSPARLWAARFEGALGLQGLGVAGHLTISLRASGQATVVTQTYDVGGGLAAMAAPVDAVLAAQLMRLKAYAEIGDPAAAR